MATKATLETEVERLKRDKELLREQKAVLEGKLMAIKAILGS